MNVTRDTVEAFLFHEADLLDDLRIEDWLALWAPECCYWVPCNDRDADGTDPGRQVSIIYDDRARLEDRVYRLLSSAAHSQRPRSRMRRVVGNIRFESREGEVHTRSNFLLAGGLVMDWMGPVGLPLASAAMLFLLVAYGLFRMGRRAPLPLEEQAEFVPLARTSPIVLEMHPQADREPELDLSEPK